MSKLFSVGVSADSSASVRARYSDPSPCFVPRPNIRLFTRKQLYSPRIGYCTGPPLQTHNYRCYLKVWASQLLVTTRAHKPSSFLELQPVETDSIDHSQMCFLHGCLPWESRTDDDGGMERSKCFLIEYPHLIPYNRSHLPDGCMSFLARWVFSRFIRSKWSVAHRQNFDVQFLLLQAVHRT